jgi:hypothetical protein
MAINNIRTSGGIFTHHFIESLQQDTLNHPAMNYQTFVLPGQDKLSEKDLEINISKAWESLVERWDVIEREFGSLDISTLRQRWLHPLFYYLNIVPEFQRRDVVLEKDLRFPISHLGRLGTTQFTLPIHTVLYVDEKTLETRTKPGRGIKNQAPHDIVQRYLNYNKEHDWALLTDGVYLRLLRDFHHTYTRGYVEFDLQGIFNSRDFAGFRAMYRLLHASRFFILEDKENSLIDNLYEDALAMGVRVGDDLLKNVQSSIESLANGFLVSSPGFLETINQKTDGAALLYRDVLMTIYRMLFMLFAEQRGMLPGRGSLYMEEFSLTAFRTKAELPRSEDRNLDLWEKIKTTFSMVEHGSEELDIFAYNGALFSLNKTPLLTPKETKIAPQCRNDYLLQTIRHLTTVEKDRVLQRISYSDLSVEEIGSIYEGLLEFTPRISESQIHVEGREIPVNSFFLDPRGTGRKTSGSYYTPVSLVNELIKSALVPVMEDRIKAVVPGYDSELVEALTDNERQSAEKAILALNVVDPAAGSGAFLIAANNKLGLELARIRTGDYFPIEQDIQRARRDVLAHCIYAVDLNPMAVELCKVSLWINAAVEDAPLNFLDHHIRWGNSLVGASPELIKKGIPNDAYKPVIGDDKEIAKAIKAQNREEVKGQIGLMRVTTLKTQEDIQNWDQISQLAEEDPCRAETTYYAYFGTEDYWEQRLPYDMWTAAFYSPLSAGETVPTTQDVRQAQADPSLISDNLRRHVKQFANQYRYFHWHFEFPEIFNGKGNGGFDVVLGNPPWEMINLEEKEFFEGKDDLIVNASTGAKRKLLIENLRQTKPNLWQDYFNALRDSEVLGKFLHDSGSFPLTSHGRINTYSVFSGKARYLMGDLGRVGIVVPTGIAIDDSNKYFFGDLVKTGQIASLFDFENRKKLFPEVDSRMKFCLLTISNDPKRIEEGASFSFFLLNPDELNNQDKIFNLSSVDFELLNPNTLTCPVFRTKSDANLTKKLYLASPILVNDLTGVNPSGIRFKQGLFNMTSSSHLFRTRQELESSGFELNGNIFEREDDIWLPLYEAKMFHHFDHRFGTFENVLSRTNSSINNISSRKTDCFALPWYWVNKNDCYERIQTNSYFIAFRNVARTTDERTAILSIVPAYGIGHSAPIIFVENNNSLELLANANSFVFDYIVRQKVGGMNFTFHYWKQLPVIVPSAYPIELKNRITCIVLELSFTSWDLLPFADEIWSSGDENLRTMILNLHEENQNTIDSRIVVQEPPVWTQHLYFNGQPEEKFLLTPFEWDEERRFQLRCELDALFGHLYGLARDEFSYILETFPIVKRKDEAKFGKYRTKLVILEEFDKLADAPMLDGVCIPLSERVSVLENPDASQPIAPQAVTTAPTPHIIPPETITKPKAAKPSKKEKTSENQTNLFVDDTDFSASKSDDGLYRCEKCGKSVMGFSIEGHSSEAHQGNEPGYQKIR